MNYTKTMTVDATGALILEFDAEELDSVIITTDVDIYLGFQDLSQAVFPLLAAANFSITHADFRNKTLLAILNRIKKILKEQTFEIQQTQNIIRIYAKRQTAGNANIYIHYLGGNL